jgi:hypothetical protein
MVPPPNLVVVGTLKISVNWNDFTLVDGSAFSKNGYLETLADQDAGSSNPLEGQGALTGPKKPWLTSELSLTKACGQPFAGGDIVTLRFEPGMDCSDGLDTGKDIFERLRRGFRCSRQR